MGRLEGKIALITGGSEGIGFDTAKEFIAEGAFVFITGRRKPELEKAVAALGPQARGIQADAGKLADLDRTYAEIKAQKGKLDILFANAGIYAAVPHDQITEEAFDQCFDINVKGVYFSIQKALPLMDKTGSILLNGSFLAKAGFPGMSVYSATKAALRSFARSFTAELRGNGPRVNVISPGPIHTPGYHTATGGSEEILANTVGFVPLGRMGTGREIGRAAVFLASEDAQFIAGADFLVDGGVDAI